MDEATLIQALKNNDRNAFSLLLARYRENLFRVSIGFLQNTEDAEEIIQDVFVEVYKKINFFRQESKLSTWLYRITVNKSINKLKQNKRNAVIKHIESFFVNSTEGEVDFPDTSIKNPEQVLEFAESNKLLNLAINSLPENQRIAFILNKFDDLPYSEVAQVMQTSVSAVESLIFRAKQNLQKKLINYRY